MKIAAMMVGSLALALSLVAEPASCQRPGPVVYRFKALRNTRLSQPAAERRFAEVIDLARDTDSVDLSILSRFTVPSVLSEQATAVITLTPSDSAGGVLWLVRVDSLRYTGSFFANSDGEGQRSSRESTVFQTRSGALSVSRIGDPRTGFISVLAPDVTALLVNRNSFPGGDSSDAMTDQRGPVAGLSDLFLERSSTKPIRMSGDSHHTQITIERNVWNLATGLTVLQVERSD